MSYCHVIACLYTFHRSMQTDWKSCNPTPPEAGPVGYPTPFTHQLTLRTEDGVMPASFSVLPKSFVEKTFLGKFVVKLIATTPY